jgi:hypothetical protein
VTSSSQGIRTKPEGRTEGRQEGRMEGRNDGGAGGRGWRFRAGKLPLAYVDVGERGGTWLSRKSGRVDRDSITGDAPLMVS